MPRITTAHLLAAILDEDSWRSWDAPVPDVDSDAAYAAELAQARAVTGVDESITTGSARIDGHAVAVVAGDFEFLAGSVGQAAAARIVAAFDRARTLGLPVVGLPTSGGTRMQEGTAAFLRMARIAAAVRTLTDSGLPYLVYLRNPTTGGVLATWGSLGDVTYAEPGALIGFLGPRVYEGLYGMPFASDVQTAETLTDAGVIDGVATPQQWRGIVVDLLSSWRARPGGAVAPPGWEAPSPDVSTAPSAAAPERVEPGQDLTGWQMVERTRATERAGAAELLAAAFHGVQVLSGTQAGERASATILAVATLDDQGCVVVAQDRQQQHQRAADAPGAGIGPGDLRVARRGMRLAQRWGLPFVTIIDTQGAELSAAAESGALAGEIARCLADLAVLQTPTMAVLIGGGGGGGALALLPADRVVAAHDAWVTPLPVEGASLIRYRTTDRAAEIADAQGIRAADLVAIAAVDRVVAAPLSDGAAWRAVLAEELAHLVAAGPVVTPRTWPAE